jgi:hypothetical protein
MIVVAFVGGRFALAGQRAQSKTQEHVASIQKRSQESRLALDMAIEARDRLDVMEDWEGSILQWWDNEHRPRDEIRDRILQQAVPDEYRNLPALTAMPRPRRRASST